MLIVSKRRNRKSPPTGGQQKITRALAKSTYPARVWNDIRHKNIFAYTGTTIVLLYRKVTLVRQPLPYTQTLPDLAEQCLTILI